jgi:hypothetical protein
MVSPSVMDVTVATSAPGGSGPAGSPEGPATGGPIGAPGSAVVVVMGPKLVVVTDTTVVVPGVDVVAVGTVVAVTVVVLSGTVATDVGLGSVEPERVGVQATFANSTAARTVFLKPLTVSGGCQARGAAANGTAKRRHQISTKR